jgi:hypothetical protein
MRTRHLVIASAALALFTASGFAQTPPPPAAAPAPTAAAPTFEGVFRVGAIGNDDSGNLNKVGEYVPLESTGKVGTEFWGERNGFRFDVNAYYGGTSRDQNYRADLDIKRLVKAHVSYQKFPHRLDHDPLTTYMDASSGLGGTFVAVSTNTDPSAQYSVGVGEFTSGVEVTTPTTIPVKFFLNHNQLRRDGSHQVMVIAHCATCHTYSYTQQMDELTRETIAGAMLQASHGSVEYSYTDSKFSDDGAGLLHQYNNAVHPATLQDIFLNRVQYDDAAGLLPIQTVPGITKGMHKLRANLVLPGDASAWAMYSQSTQRNDDTRLEVDFKGFSGRIFVPIKQRFSFKADVKRYDIKADDVFVDVIELVAPAGLLAGLTYAQAYPTFGNPDFVRQSELSRTPTEFTMEFGAQPVKRTFLRAGYQWNQVERDHFDVEKTTTNTFYVTGRSQMGKKANARFRLQYDDITDPFTYENAAIPQVLQPYPSPGTPPSPLTGLQYFSMYRSRQGDLTAFPNSALRFDGTVTITPTERTAMTFHYNYRDASNEELNYSEWGRTVHTPGVDLFYSPGDKWTLSAGYVYHKERLETLFTTLAFSG